MLSKPGLSDNFTLFIFFITFSFNVTAVQLVSASQDGLLILLDKVLWKKRGWSISVGCKSRGHRREFWLSIEFRQDGMDGCHEENVPDGLSFLVFRLATPLWLLPMFAGALICTYYLHFWPPVCLPFIKSKVPNQNFSLPFHLQYIGPKRSTGTSIFNQPMIWLFRRIIFRVAPPTLPGISKNDESRVHRRRAIHAYSYEYYCFSDFHWLYRATRPKTAGFSQNRCGQGAVWCR